MNVAHATPAIPILNALTKIISIKIFVTEDTARKIKGVFDNNHELKGKKIGSLDIMMMDELKGFIKENNIEIVALTIPRQAAREVAKEVAEDGIKAIWNFAHTDLNMPEDVVVENVHLSESLMRLSYNIANKNGKTRNIQEG